MKAVALFLLAASLQASTASKITLAAGATTIAVNLLSIDKTAHSAWKAWKVARKATVKAAKKAVGK